MDDNQALPSGISEWLLQCVWATNWHLWSNV